MMKGLLWSVGDGRKVYIWKDPWVPNMKGFRLQHIEGVDIDREEKVALLLNKKQRS